MARALLVSVGVLAALALPACAAADGAAPAAGAPASSEAAARATPTAVGSAVDDVQLPDLEQFSPAPSGVIDEDTGETIQPRTVPTWDEASRADAVSAAETVMTAFARPDLDEDTWWAGVQPLLTPQAAQDYAYVDPASVPATQVSGPGTLVEDTSAYVAGVEVPTDVGAYLVLLSRADATAPWRVERLTPAAEVG